MSISAFDSVSMIICWVSRCKIGNCISWTDKGGMGGEYIMASTDWLRSWDENWGGSVA